MPPTESHAAKSGDHEPRSQDPRSLDPTAQPELPILTRVLLIVLGWLLLLLGVVGSLLPVLQGWLFFALGAATLSLVSVTAMRFMRWCFRPWPRGWRRILRARRRILQKLVD